MFLFRGVAVSAMIVLLMMTGCKGKSSPVDPPKTTPPPATKSVKRGIAYNIASSTDLAALSSSVSWWYNWGKTPSSSLIVDYRNTYGMDFIPMLWGGNTSSSDIVTVENFLLDHP